MPNLFKRTLIRTGNGALVVVVPRPWTRYYGLKAGDKLEVIANGELIIRPEKERLSITKPQRPNCE